MAFEPGSALWIVVVVALASVLGGSLKGYLARSRKPTPPDWEHPVQKVLFRQRKVSAPPKLITDQRDRDRL